MTATATQIMEGAASVLAQASVGVWNPDGAYTPAQTGITIKRVPQSPDRIIALTVYNRNGNPDPNLPDHMVWLQVRIRVAKGRPDAADQVAEAVDTVLAGHGLTWGQVRVARSHRVSYIPIGADSSDREELTCNYELVLPQ